MTATATHPSVHSTFLNSRRRSALALLAGALTMELVIERQALAFYYTPLIVGLTYLAAALVAGRKGALWAPGIITTCWGISVLLGVHGVTTIDSKILYEIAAVIGVLIALGLRFGAGIAAGPVGIVVSLAVILVHNYAHNVPSWIFHGVTFAVLLGAWGLWELRPSSADKPHATETTADRTDTVDLRDDVAASSSIRG